MKLKEIVRAYAAGTLSKSETREKIQALDLPTFDSDWDGKWAVSGDPENDLVILAHLEGRGEISESQFDELLSFFPDDHEYKVSPSTLDKEMMGKVRAQ